MTSQHRPPLSREAYENLQGKLLFRMGELDENVPPGQEFMVRNLTGREPPAGYRIEVNRR